MKKNNLQMTRLFLFCVFICSGCVKIIDHHDNCRIISSTSEFGTTSCTYNQMGLLDRYHIGYYNGYFKMEYDASGRLVKSRLYLDSADVLKTTVVFLYQNDKIVKETWYDKDTRTKTDEIFYTFNADGLVSKARSSIQQYTLIYKYTPDGKSVVEEDVYYGGILAFKVEFTYLPPHHRDPFAATPGLKYDFAYLGAPSQWYSTSESETVYDSTGKNPQVVLDQDPTKSVITFNLHNYVTATDYYDTISKTWVHFKFEFENCGLGDWDLGNYSQKLPAVNTSKITPLHLLRVGGVKSMKEQLKELREQYFKK